MPDRDLEATIELSSDLVVRSLSEGARALYGLEEDIEGRRLVDVLMADSGHIEWAAHWAAVLAGKPFEELMLHRSCSGPRVWVFARLEAHADGARLGVRRASGREVLEHQPAALLATIGEMLAVGGVGLWLGDVITEEFDWSECARALHDLAPDTELTPEVLFGQMHPDDRAEAAAVMQQGMAQRVPYDLWLRVRASATDYRHLRVFGGLCYDAAGYPLIAVGGMYDVSSLVALRKRVRELEEGLRAAQRGDVLGRLAGGVAHDFNNILTTILGCCEMLGQSELPSDPSKDVQRIRKATLRAADLTQQLLALGGRQALRRRAVSPAAVLADLLSLLRRTVPENVEIRLLSTETRSRVLVDVTQLHQVLTNLVVNAAQAMPGGGRIEIAAEQVTPAAGEGPREGAAELVRFVVEDTGPGVPRELRTRIFEPFFSTKPPGQGSGLGLSVVQGIVDQHGGHIRVCEGSLGGARFEVSLPATEEAADVSSETAPPDEEAVQDLRRILLVEDEESVRELTKRMLLAAGFEVKEAADANEALEHAKGEVFDVLVTDVVLPGMSGPELVRRLRASGLTFAVVYISGYPVDFVERQVPIVEREVLVQKPFTARALLAAVRVRRREPTKSSSASQPTRSA